MKKPILLAVAMLALGAAFFAYKAYYKEHTDVATADVMQELSATELFSAFDADEQAATMKYAEKVVTVNGLLLRRDLSNEVAPQIVLEGNGDDGFIRCGFSSEDLQKTIDLTDSTQVKIKGLCKGFNDAGDLDLLADRDVVLSNCIIIE